MKQGMGCKSDFSTEEELAILGLIESEEFHQGTVSGDIRWGDLPERVQQYLLVWDPEAKGDFHDEDTLTECGLDEDQLQHLADEGYEYDPETGLVWDAVLDRVVDLDVVLAHFGAMEDEWEGDLVADRPRFVSIETLELAGDGEVDLDGDDWGTTTGLRTYGVEELVVTAVDRGVDLRDVRPAGETQAPKPKGHNRNRNGNGNRRRQAPSPELKAAHAEAMVVFTNRGGRDTQVGATPCTVEVSGKQVPATRYAQRLAGVTLFVEVPNLPERPQARRRRA